MTAVAQLQAFAANGVRAQQAVDYLTADRERRIAPPISRIVCPIVAIDPGPKTSGLLTWTGKRIDYADVLANADVLAFVGQLEGGVLAIEMIASYGMPVGREVFETCVWIGRFQQAWLKPNEVLRVQRLAVKMHLCHSARANDANIWAALVDRFGPVGTVKQPGFLHRIRSHTRAALALAVTVADHLATGELDRLRSGT